MNAEQLHRDIGRLEGQVTALQSKVDLMDGKLTEALAALHKKHGAGIAYSSVAAAIVSFLTAWFVR